MRRNKFNEAYCHTAEEARVEIERGEVLWEVYVDRVEPPELSTPATAEVLENVSGDLVCYIEADTEEGVRKIINELGIEILS